MKQPGTISRTEVVPLRVVLQIKSDPAEYAACGERLQALINAAIAEVERASWRVDGDLRSLDDYLRAGRIRWYELWGSYIFESVELRVSRCYYRPSPPPPSGGQDRSPINWLADRRHQVKLLETLSAWVAGTGGLAVLYLVGRCCGGELAHAIGYDLGSGLLLTFGVLMLWPVGVLLQTGNPVLVLWLYVLPGALHILAARLDPDPRSKAIKLAGADMYQGAIFVLGKHVWTCAGHHHFSEKDATACADVERWRWANNPQPGLASVAFQQGSGGSATRPPQESARSAALRRRLTGSTALGTAMSAMVTAPARRRRDGP
jgi:hypothetical protein